MRHQEDSTAPQQQVGTAPRRDSARLLERKTTLAAIAAEAGVSLPTVSKVVNGRPDVAPATRARVEQLLDQHQYSRNGMRRNRRSGLIDVVFAGLDSPWAVEILRGIEEWGAQHETAVAVSSVRHGNARP
ncbi:MAG TPA: LacI family DNA-binding transcriptional regulator, partial [Streptosporangiaceae bacterium]|nr:LacI family DNA-binding transcriptional regulator [Streptosporangiaceae bacterium]